VLLDFFHHELDCFLQLRIASFFHQVGSVVDLDVGRDAAVFDLPLAVEAVESEFWTGNISAIDQRNFSADAAHAAPGALSNERPEFIDFEEVAEKIRDPLIRHLALVRLSEFKNDPKEAFATPLLHKDGKTPIRKVRITVTFNEGSLFAIPREGYNYKFHEFSNNHHMEIVRDFKNLNWEGKLVSTMEAADRARRGKQPVIKQNHGPGHEFVMALCINDMLEIIQQGQKCIVRVQKMTKGKLTLRDHRVARVDEDVGRYIVTPNSLRTYQPQKIEVSPIGEISRVTHLTYD